MTVALARHEQVRGRPLAAIARELGVPFGTLRHWLATPAGVFRPVTVTTTAPSDARPEMAGGATAHALVVITPGGHRIEGLDLAGVIAVVRGLEAHA